MSLKKFLSVFFFFFKRWENGSPASANIPSLKPDSLQGQRFGID